MKKVIEQIKKIEGAKEVYLVGDNMVLSVFEPVVVKKNKQAVHCETQEQWDFVTKERGYEWDDARWLCYKNDSAISLNSKSFGSVEHNRGLSNFQILTFSEYLKQEELEKEWEAFKLAEAKTRYPIGTRFYPAHLEIKRDRYCIIISHKLSEPNEFLGNISFESSHSGKKWIPNVYTGSKWAEIIKPVCKTEDNVFLYEGDSCIYVGTNPNDKGSYMKPCHWSLFPENPDIKDRLLFSTKQAAERWIEENKQIELADFPRPSALYYCRENEGIAKTFRDANTNKWYYESDLLEIFSENIINRIKQ